MARANRHHVPGHVWHMTHRCHKREFLLKFSKDKKLWPRWLFEAKKRFGLRMLNHAATSDHVRLLALDTDEDVIPKSVQLAAGRTGQESDARKKRKGAFRDDRCHATAVEGDRHLIRCLVCIDPSMVRAGAVKHPSPWPLCGHDEICRPKQRHSPIRRDELANMLGMADASELGTYYGRRVGEAARNEPNPREPERTESIAVGSSQLVEATKTELGIMAGGRRVTGQNGTFSLREGQEPHSAVFDPEKAVSSTGNRYFRNESDVITVGWLGPTPFAFTHKKMAGGACFFQTKNGVIADFFYQQSVFIFGVQYHAPYRDGIRPRKRTRLP